MKTYYEVCERKSLGGGWTQSSWNYMSGWRAWIVRLLFR